MGFGLYIPTLRKCAAVGVTHSLSLGHTEASSPSTMFSFSVRSAWNIVERDISLVSPYRSTVPQHGNFTNRSYSRRPRAPTIETIHTGYKILFEWVNIYSLFSLNKWKRKKITNYGGWLHRRFIRARDWTSIDPWSQIIIAGFTFLPEHKTDASFSHSIFRKKNVWKIW